MIFNQILFSITQYQLRQRSGQPDQTKKRNAAPPGIGENLIRDDPDKSEFQLESRDKHRQLSTSTCRSSGVHT